MGLLRYLARNVGLCEAEALDTPDPIGFPVGGLAAHESGNTTVAAVDVGQTVRRAGPPTGCHSPEVGRTKLRTVRLQRFGAHGSPAQCARSPLCR